MNFWKIIGIINITAPICFVVWKKLLNMFCSPYYSMSSFILYFLTLSSKRLVCFPYRYLRFQRIVKLHKKYFIILKIMSNTYLFCNPCDAIWGSALVRQVFWGLCFNTADRLVEYFLYNIACCVGNFENHLGWVLQFRVSFRGVLQYKMWLR